MRRSLRDNNLTIFFGIAFLAALTGQAIAGHIGSPESKPVGAPRDETAVEG